MLDSLGTVTYFKISKKFQSENLSVTNKISSQIILYQVELMVMLNNKSIIIAEIGVNHNGNLAIAKKLILAAKKLVLITLSFNVIKLKI